MDVLPPPHGIPPLVDMAVHHRSTRLSEIISLAITTVDREQSIGREIMVFVFYVYYVLASLW